MERRWFRIWESKLLLTPPVFKCFQVRHGNAVAWHRKLTPGHSTTKVKKFGFFGFVDSYESILSVADEFVGLKIIPHPNSITPKSS